MMIMMLHNMLFRQRNGFSCFTAFGHCQLWVFVVELTPYQVNSKAMTKRSRAVAAAERENGWWKFSCSRLEGRFGASALKCSKWGRMAALRL